MDCIMECPLNEKRKKLPTVNFTVESLVKAGRIKLADVYELQKKLQNEGPLPQLTDEQAACFLLSCNNNIQQSIITIKTHYKLKKTQLKHIFMNRDVDRPELQKQLQICSYYAILPRSQEGYATIFVKQQNVHAFNHADFCTAFFMLFDTALYDSSYDSPPTGLIVLCDMKGVSLLHLVKLQYSLVKAASDFFQEGLQIQLIKIYVFNVLWFISKFMAFLTPMLNEHMLSHLHFFPPAAGVEELYKYFNKTDLPEEFGGELPSYKILHEKVIEKMRGMKTYFDEEERQWLESI